MSRPTNHYLAITDTRDNQIRGKVVYLQPKIHRAIENAPVVHIVTSDWLDPYRYKAVYNTPTKSVSGFFVVRKYRMEAQDYLFEGTFEHMM